MPELPEVETTRRGIAPLLLGQCVTQVRLRIDKLRWPVPRNLDEVLVGQCLQAVERRAKYLLLRFGSGTLLLHLGMSGHLRVVPTPTPPGKHDHFDLEFASGACLRLNDARRFGALLWTTADPLEHPLLVEFGPEPFAAQMSGAYLHAAAARRSLAVKAFIMDQRVLVGVGNIYASEALFRAGIHPERPAGSLTRPRFDRLAGAICQVLREAIEAGGTTLRDFVNEQGRPGYFSLQLKVYGREGEPCPACGRPIAQTRIGQRSTFFCRRCQR